ncbi:MAG TPA: TPM domain-containing protein [Acidimicrobiales bacterium]|nr:TPM domain-containing protein [Acidimicrobiales bacterium]
MVNGLSGCAAGALLMLSVFFVTHVPAQAQAPTPESFPPFSAPVVDQAGVVPDDVETRVNEALLDYQARSTNQVAVAVVRTTGQKPIEEYSLELARTWALGTKERNNGVLLLIAHEDRRLRIEVGVGLETVLPDAEAQRIIDIHVVPLLQQGDVGAALIAGTNAIRRALGDPEVGEPRQEAAPPFTPEPVDGEFTPELGNGDFGFDGGRDDNPFSWFVPLFILVAVIGVVSSFFRGGSGWGGGRSPMFFGTGWGNDHSEHSSHHGRGFFGGGFSGGGFSGGGFSGGGSGRGGGSSSSGGSSSGGGGGSFGGGGASGSW